MVPYNISYSFWFISSGDVNRGCFHARTEIQLMFAPLAISLYILFVHIAHYKRSPTIATLQCMSLCSGNKSRYSKFNWNICIFNEM